jgi:NADPH:quinone reductase-like Zn-dependent oxidoreductase
MRAVVYDRYGPPESLRVDDVPTPSPTTNQVLLRVLATSVNLSDWECLRGAPLYARLGGLRTPARRTLGSDVAGRVEAVGSGVTRFGVGDEVYGDNLQLKGGFAEYAVAPESALAPKPEELTFAQVSAIPQAAAIALRGTAGVAAGQHVLINGAGGGSGSFAIQLAKRAGAHVTVAGGRRHPGSGHRRADGPQASGRAGRHPGSAIGAHYRHTTPEMAARVVAAVEERLVVVLATAEAAVDQQLW